METLKFEIRMSNDEDLDIIFYPSSMQKNEFSCTLSALKTTYNIQSTYEINASLIKKIIKDSKYKVITTIDFSNKVITTKNRTRRYIFQTEDNLTLISDLKTNEEMFIPANNIKNTWTFNAGNWRELKEKKNTLVPLSNNIQTSETNMFEQ